MELVYWFRNLRQKMGNSGVQLQHSMPGKTEWEVGRDFLNMVSWMAGAGH